MKPIEHFLVLMALVGIIGVVATVALAMFVGQWWRTAMSIDVDFTAWEDRSSPSYPWLFPVTERPVALPPTAKEALAWSAKSDRRTKTLKIWEGELRNAERLLT
jgi:hypothetical protein